MGHLLWHAIHGGAAIRLLWWGHVVCAVRGRTSPVLRLLVCPVLVRLLVCPLLVHCLRLRLSVHARGCRSTTVRGRVNDQGRCVCAVAATVVLAAAVDADARDERKKDDGDDDAEDDAEG